MIETLAISIGLVGLVLFGLLILGILRVTKAIKLGRFRSSTAGVSDLLTHASVVEDGIILCKSGAFMAAWIYAGDDHANTTDTEKEHVSSLVNAAIKEFGNGYMIHVDAVRRAVPSYMENSLSHFPDPVSAAIDAERRVFFEGQDTMYEGYNVLTLTWYPPTLAQSKFVELMFDDDAALQNQDNQKYLSKLLAHFQKDIDNIESRLSTVLRLERLQSRQEVQENGSIAVYDDFLSHLQFCITGINQPMRLPNMPVYLDCLLGGQELFGGVVPKIGQNFIQVVAIEGFPLESYPGMLSALTDIDTEYRWSNRFIFKDQHEAVSDMNSFRKKWKQKQRGLMDVIFHTNSSPNADAVAMTEDAEVAMAEVQSGLTGAGLYTAAVVLMHTDRARLEHSSQKLQKLIFSLGFSARIETVNTIEAWLGSIPGHGVENVRRPTINTMNLADFLPLSTIWTGTDAAPCPLYPPNSPALMYGVTSGNAPFRINLHVRDVGHTIMFGPTGAGKSTALATIVAQFRRYEGMKIFVFDKGMSMYALTRGCRGEHFTINGDDSKLQFCPLQYLDTPSDRAWAKEWINTILALNDIQTSVEQRAQIGNALESLSHSEQKTVTAFSHMIQDMPIRHCLQESYTVGGTIGGLLDADSDGLGMSSFMTFELEELMRLPDKFALPVLLYLFRRIESALDGSPAIIVLDEAWLMLGHKVFAEKIVEWLRVLRKANCAVIMATQNLIDAANSDIFPIIVENTATKIFLPNPFARNENIAAVYERMGLNSQQVNIIAQAEAKREYYLSCEYGSRLFSLNLQEFALAFVAASDKDSVAYMQKLEKLYGDDWLEHWLAKRNIDVNKYMELAS
ncbi:MAG: conjugal transfer protein TrbE [Pseudomonadota bacterium]